MKTQTYLPSPAEISETFRSEISNLAGTVAFEHVTGKSLFLRAVLPHSRDVKEDDRIDHGVAVRTEGPELFVHPYSFREICTNGAIHITNIRSKAIELGTSSGETAMVDCLFRQAIQSCGSLEAFQANLEEMRDAMNRRVNMAIVMSSMARRGVLSRTMNRIIDRFNTQPDRSGFGLMNAITAQARDTTNQEEKWKLETIGGGIIAWLEKPDSWSTDSLGIHSHSRFSDALAAHEAATSGNCKVPEERYSSAC